MNDRIKKLRRKLDLTQQEFAARIGSVQNTITGYETGRRVPSNQVISLICKEFNVNEAWLRTGEGGDDAMFVPASPRSKLDDLAAAHGLSEDQLVLLEKFIGLKPEIRQGILDYIMDVAAAVGGTVPATSASPAPAEMSAAELHAELDRQIALEKSTEEKSEVS